MSTLVDISLERWRMLYEKYRDDPAQLTDLEAWSAKRRIVREEMLQLLHSYLADQVSAEEFKTTFDRKTRKEWDAFKLGGHLVLCFSICL